MREIKCPKCGSVFTVDEADYASIVSQVKDAEFNEEVNRRLQELHQQHLAEQQSAEAKIEKDHQAELNKKELEISQLKASLQSIEQQKRSELDLALAAKDKTIDDLRNQIAQSAQQQQIAVMEVRQKAKDYVSQKEQEITRLLAEVKTQQLEADSKMAVLCEKYEGELKSAQELVNYY